MSSPLQSAYDQAIAEEQAVMDELRAINAELAEVKADRQLALERLRAAQSAIRKARYDMHEAERRRYERQIRRQYGAPERRREEREE